MRGSRNADKTALRSSNMTTTTHVDDDDDDEVARMHKRLDALLIKNVNFKLIAHLRSTGVWMRASDYRCTSLVGSMGGRAGGQGGRATAHLYFI